MQLEDNKNVIRSLHDAPVIHVSSSPSPPSLGDHLVPRHFWKPVNTVMLLAQYLNSCTFSGMHRRSKSFSLPNAPLFIWLVSFICLLSLVLKYKLLLSFNQVCLCPGLVCIAPPEERSAFPFVQKFISCYVWFKIFTWHWQWTTNYTCIIGANRES